MEQRLVAAAEAVRQRELVERRCVNLQARIRQTRTLVDDLRAAHADELRDADRLAGVSLARVLAELRGTRADALTRARAEADAAGYQVAQAQSQLDALTREYDQARSRLKQLGSAPEDLAAALAEKAALQRRGGDPRAARILELAAQRGRLSGELREVEEAQRAAKSARRALALVADILGRASGWSIYDTFFGGGMLSSAIKHSRLDEAALAAAEADRRLAVLRTELADVVGLGLTGRRLAVDGLTRFVDVFLDNVFTDLSVRNQIQQARLNVARSDRLVRRVAERLEERGVQARALLAEIEAERQELLRQGPARTA